MSDKIVVLALFTLSVSIILPSCKKELKSDVVATEEQPLTTAASKKKTAATALLNTEGYRLQEKASTSSVFDNRYSEFVKKLTAYRAAGNAVMPSECSFTEFDKVIDKYISQFGPLEFALYGEYATVNYYATLLDDSKQYFGAKGENTHLVLKQQRKLESFWNMPNEIFIKGEHNSALNDRDRIAEVYIVAAGFTSQEAYAIADEIIAINQQSPVFIETPLLSFDAFSTTTTNLIVLGDGIIQTLAEAGVDNDIVVSGILSHEWVHQIQVNNAPDWYGFELAERPNTAEFTRLMELEADFFTGYYLTHKRGGTYNWKRVAEFLELFYNIGDCSFTSPGHHGTPNQRLAASRLGSIIADETLPKGHILSADELHSLFLAGYDDIIANTISTEQALARLKTKELKAIYKAILAYKTQLEAIANGK